MQHRVWITGASGLIGGYLAKSAPAHCEILQPSRSELDLTDRPKVTRYFQTEQPDMIIHCAALSRTTHCQQNPALARRINVEVTSHLAQLIADKRMIFFSTDLVFDGQRGNYAESDGVNPLSVYGETKASAETVVTANPGHIVVRTSLNGGISTAGDRGFNEEMRNEWRAKRAVKLFVDEFRSPIAAEVTASVIWKLAWTMASGIFHLAGRERLSRYELGQMLALRHSKLHPKIEAISLRDYHGAPRAPDTSLDCQKIEELLSMNLPALSTWLREHPTIDF